MIENVRGFLGSTFDGYRRSIFDKLNGMGYNLHVSLLNASDYGVPQLRPRAIIVGIRHDLFDSFEFPQKRDISEVTVGETLYDLMAARGWKQADVWRDKANRIAPTLVGGSKKHGGPDLGPTRARQAWAELGIDGRGVATEAPEQGFDGMPRLTPRMLARLQGFPDSWDFGPKKTAACRMIGNAFPPPVAKAVGLQIKKVLEYGLIDSKSETKISPRAVG